MKVLIYEPNSGFTSYTKPLANALSVISDLDVSFMTVKNNTELNGISSNVDVLDILCEFNSSFKHGSFRWLYNRVQISLKNILKRNRIISKSDYDAVVVEFTLPVIDQFLFNKIKKKATLIYAVHDVIPPRKSRFWSMNSLKKVYNTADHLIVHSRENKQELMSKFQIDNEKISIIHHGVEANKSIPKKSECRQKLGIAQEENVVLFYGGIRPQKGLDNLIQSLENVESTLIIAGSLPHGESFEVYDRLIAKHKIKTLKRIEYISDEMTDVFFGAADIIALPYKYFSSQSGVFMQAIQYHKLIVASDVSSFASYIDTYKLGLICKPNDIESLRDAIITGIRDKESLYNDAKFDVALLNNSWESAAQKHYDVIEQTVNGRL